MSKNEKIKNLVQLVLMISITFLIQLLMIMKTSVVAGKFGISEEMDAYNFSNNIATFITGMVSSGMTTVIIPAYLKKKKKKSLNTFVTVVYGIILVLMSIIIIFRKPLINIFSNRSEVFIETSSNLLIILFTTQFLSIITGVTDAFFQCRNDYNKPKVINLISQSLVVFSLVFYPKINIYNYTIILSAGILINLIVNIIFAVFDGFRYKICLEFKDAEYRQMINIFIPTIFSSGIYRLSLLIDSVISSNLDSGKLSILNYSNQIINMINTLLIGNLLIYIYPKIIRKLRENEDQKSFWDYTIFFHMIICLVIVVFFIIGKEGIILLFQRGEFTYDITKYVFLCSSIYIIGQQSNVIRDLIYRYFYAVGDTKTTVKNSIMVSIVNIITSIILVNVLGLYGVILGTVIASFVSLISIMIKFDKKFKIDISKTMLITEYAKNILSLLITFGIILFIKNSLVINNIILNIIFYGILTASIFVLILFIFKSRVFKVDI
ncbi:MULTISPECIES: murein biosynthesis integral membrane protein MurJ [Clostridium]|uniref:murein biosynthesis integral membrane protein MurJ n=1 Tax=Clostridium TaxID=1485 RepID=UPI00115B0441|nr:MULTISPECIES: lipid II flippase MurJ [Clostridium]MDU2155650.1 lipid II flippase MurJ [Clostridium sp.]